MDALTLPLPDRLAEPVAAPAAVLEKLAAEVQRLETQLKGRLGFAARHLQTGVELGVNAGERFPMASTFKIAIAGTALSRVDRGELSLDTMVAVTAEHHRQTGDIAEGVIHPGVSLSLANLVEIMLIHSNNNATDRVLDGVGGPAGVTAWLAACGIGGLRVDRSVNEILNDFYGFPAGSEAMASYLAAFPTDEDKEAANGRVGSGFDADPRDSCTPAAMLELLARLFSGTLLKPASRGFLFDTMARCRTGADRIKGLLPAGTCVAHKTGTIGGTINDAGVIVLPDGGGHLALAVYTRDSTVNPYPKRERLLGEIARSLYDVYRFLPAQPR